MLMRMPEQLPSFNHRFLKFEYLLFVVLTRHVAFMKDIDIMIYMVIV